MEKTHIRTVNPEANKYMGEWDLPLQNNGEKKLTIKSVGKVEVLINGTTKKESKIAVYFNEHKLPMILNATNRAAIISSVKSPYIEDWVGKIVLLYREVGVKAFGKVTDCIRIRPVAIQSMIERAKEKIENLVFEDFPKIAAYTFSDAEKIDLQNLLADILVAAKPDLTEGNKAAILTIISETSLNLCYENL